MTFLRCFKVPNFSNFTGLQGDIEREFSKFCRVKRVHLVVDKSSRKPRCFGFVKFLSKAEVFFAKKNKKKHVGICWMFHDVSLFLLFNVDFVRCCNGLKKKKKTHRL